MNSNLISFDAERASRYIEESFNLFLMDPPDSDYQRGFLASLLVIYREGLGKGAGDDRLTLLDRMVEA